MAAVVDFNTLPELFAGLVDYHAPDRTALGFKHRKKKEWVEISWADLAERVRAMSGFLYDVGIRKGDRVALLTENRPEWAVVDLACQNLGAINVSMYTSLPTSQVAYILQDSGASAFFVSTSIQLRKATEAFDSCPDLGLIVTMTKPRTEKPDHVMTWKKAMKRGRDAWPRHESAISDLTKSVVPADVAVLIYTSGTTGTPKGVMLTHENLCSNTTSALGLVPFGPTDHHLSFLPLCHSFERTAGYTAVLAAGARITYAEGVDMVSRNLVEVKPTVLLSVPRLFERVYNTVQKSAQEGSAIKRRIFDWSVESGKRFAVARKAGRTPGPLLTMRNALGQRLVFSKLRAKLGGNLRFAVSGGAALPRKVGEFFEAAGIKLIEGYGLTETSPVLCVNPMERPRYGTVGHVLPGVTVAIQRLADGEIIAELSGDGYPSDLTSSDGEILAKGPNIMAGYWNHDDWTRESIDDAGWYHTGDVGRFDGGYVQITDRIKHMIVSKGGKNIYPGPIEDGFKTVKWIDQILVVGEGREYLAALVVPSMDVLRTHAEDEGIEFATESDLLADDRILALFEKEFKAYSRGAASHEKIRAFRLIADPFTVDNGLLTPTLKPRRREIEKAYGDAIEELYEARPSVSR